MRDSKPAISSSFPQASSFESRVSDTKLPLEGFRVADFSWGWAGPYCTMHLAYLGAEVIKIESKAHLDLMRRLPIVPKGVTPGYDASGPFNQWNQGEKSIRLNLQKTEGLALAKRLIQH